MSVRPDPEYSSASPFLPAAEAPSGGFTVRPEDLWRLFFISLAVLGGGYVLGNFTYTQIQGRGTAYFILAACAAILLTALAYYRFEWCLLGFLVVATFPGGVTPDVATGVSSGSGKSLMPVELEAVFLLFMWVVRGASQGNFVFARTPVNRMLVVYLLFGIWTSVNGLLFWDAGVARYFFNHGLTNGGRTPLPVYVIENGLRAISVAVFWMFASTLTNARLLRAASLLFLYPGIATTLQDFHLLPLSLTGGYNGLLQIGFAAVLFAWLIGERDAGGVQADRARLLRGLGWAVLFALIFQVFFLKIRWISGWMGLFVGLYYVAFLRSKKLFAWLLCVGLILAVLGRPFLHHNVVQKVQTSGDTARFDMAHMALNFALKSPLGIGVGNWRVYSQVYGGSNAGFTSAHGFYSQALAETGLVGLVLTVAWVVAALVLVTRIFRRMPTGWARTAVQGLAGMWAGLAVSDLIGDYFIPVYHNGGIYSFGATIYAWVGLGIAVAYARYYGILNADGKVAGAPRPAGDGATRRLSAAEYYPRRMGTERTFR